MSRSIVFVVRAARVNKKKVFRASSRAGRCVGLVGQKSSTLVKFWKIFSVFFQRKDCSNEKVRHFFKTPTNTPTTTRETHFLKRETRNASSTSSPLSLSLSLCVRARKTHLLWTKERHFKNVKREREREKREREFLRSFFFSERERERISILKSRDFLPFVLTLSLLIRACITSAKAATRAFPGNAFVCL